MRKVISALVLFSALCFCHHAAASDSGYRIEVQLAHFTGDTLRLGYYFGKSTYLKDTALVDKGKYIFEGDEALKPGVYLIVIPPDNRFIHVLVPDGNQKFSVSFDIDDIVHSARFKGSPENEIYYSYLSQLDERRPRADELRKLMQDDSLHADQYKPEMEKIDADVRKVQDNLVQKHPESMTAMLIRANQEIDIPDFNGLSEEDRKMAQYHYYHDHYFDHFDLSDPRAMRSGIIHNKIDFYTQKLCYPMPDSQIVAIDYLLDKMKSNEEAFQYYLVYFLNEAARSKRMGMDAVYVHLVDTYYAKGLAPWADDEQVNKLKAQAETTRPLLIGKVAPDLVFRMEDGRPVSIHSIDAEYTVLFFWDPECSHCKKQIPFVIDFYNEYKDKGVKVLAICTKTGDDISSCWSAIKERGMDIWVNAADQYLQNRYKAIYDVKTTPQIFVLDKYKKIVAKKLSGEDLKMVIDELMKVKG